MQRLRRLCAGLSGDCIAVACGGFSTDARWTPRGPQRERCADCDRATVPSVEHIFWHCRREAFSCLRSFPKPRSRFRARLGWSPVPLRGIDEKAFLRQLGAIRAEETLRRRYRPAWQGHGHGRHSVVAGNAGMNPGGSL